MNKLLMGRGRTACLAGTVIALASAAGARAAEPTTQELLDQINQLKADVARLEAKQSADVTRRDESAARDTSAAVLHDADRRSQLFDPEGFTAGYSDGKFLIQSGDGRFVLHPFIQFQFRSVTNWRQDGAPGSSHGDDVENGFEVRRLKLGFDGNVFGPDLNYMFQWATDRKDGAPKLEDGWVKYKFTDSPFGVRAGQIKNPFAHEQLASSKYLLAVERSLIDQLFANGDGYVQGATLIYDPGTNVRGEIGVTDGIRSANTNFQDFPATSADWGTAGRIDYKLFGNFKDYDRLSPQGYKEKLCVIGVGYDYTQAGDTGALMNTFDAFYGDPHGLGLYGASLTRYTTHNSGAPGSNGGSVDPALLGGHHTFDYGFVAQASYLLTPHFEPFVRYDAIFFDAESVSATQTRDVHEITAGMNYYFHNHNAKVTVDVTYLPNGSPVSDDGSGVLSTGKDDDELMLRAQFQLLL